jgi:hypothetical protein
MNAPICIFVKKCPTIWIISTNYGNRITIALGLDQQINV